MRKYEEFPLVYPCLLFLPGFGVQIPKKGLSRIRILRILALRLRKHSNPMTYLEMPLFWLPHAKKETLSLCEQDKFGLNVMVFRLTGGGNAHLVMRVPTKMLTSLLNRFLSDVVVLRGFL